MVENKTCLSFADSAKAPRHCEINPGHRILVVDDEDDIRRINTLILRDAGYKVDSVTDGTPPAAKPERKDDDGDARR